MNYSIGSVSQLLGISTGTLRNWEKEGAFPHPIRRGLKRQRVYSDRDIEQIRKHMEEHYVT